MCATTTATRQDWTTLPLPEEVETFPFAREYSAAEHERLRAGFIPSGNDDKWFLYFEEGYLYLHRSWTGFCIYRVRLEPSPTGARTTEVAINRRPDQYRGLANELEVLRDLLDLHAGRTRK